MTRQTVQTRGTSRAAATAAPTKRRPVEAEPTRKRHPSVETKAPTRARRATSAAPAKPARPAKYADVRPLKEMPTRAGLIEMLAENANVEKAIVKDVIEELSKVIVGCVKSRNGKFVLAGMFRIITARRPAVKGGKTVKNPFKPGETMLTKDRPARVIVKVRAGKDLKEAVA